MTSFPNVNRSKVALLLCLVFAPLIAPRVPIAAAQFSSPSPKPPSSSLSPEKLFQQVSPSVLVIEALGPDGKVLSQGSGVVVAREEVVTNRHVVTGGASVRVRRGSQTWAATIAHWDPAHDLVQLRVLGLAARPVPVRSSSTLQTGERVYAIGAPEGLELTLSEGLISSLRPYEGVQLIQTTAPISTGSSGGGLFDGQGRLIGITTFQGKEGQNLNFALPGEWVRALPTHPAGPPIAGGRVPTLEDAVVWFYFGSAAFEAENWAKAIQAFREAIRLMPGFVAAWTSLGVSLYRQGQYA